MAKNSNHSKKPFSISKPWRIRTTFQQGDIESLTSLHGTTYQKEYGYDHTFETYVGEGLSKFADFYDSKQERIWIVEKDNQIIGCIAIIRHTKDQAQLRWFFVHPEYRGHGIGTFLLSEALSFCTQHNYKTVFLWTTYELDTARVLYLRSGFIKTEEINHKLWGKTVTEERYERHF